MIRLPMIVWLPDRTHTDGGDIIDTPALRGFCLMEPTRDGRKPNDIYRVDILIPFADRERPSYVAAQVAKAWEKIARYLDQEIGKHP